MSIEQIQKPQPTVEKRPETIPTKEEVLAVFKRLLNEEEIPIDRICEDKQGLYLWEFRIQKEDGDVEYLYQRKGRFPEGEASATVIEVTYYDIGGIPISGSTAARFEDGRWMIL